MTTATGTIVPDLPPGRLDGRRAADAVRYASPMRLNRLPRALLPALAAAAILVASLGLVFGPRADAFHPRWEMASAPMDLKRVGTRAYASLGAGQIVSFDLPMTNLIRVG